MSLSDTKVRMGRGDEHMNVLVMDIEIDSVTGRMRVRRVMDADGHGHGLGGLRVTVEGWPGPEENRQMELIDADAGVRE